MQCHFVFQDAFLEREEAGWLPARLTDEGIITSVVTPQALQRLSEPATEPDGPIVSVGSIAFCRKAIQFKIGLPGAYYSDTRYRYSDYLPKVDSSLFLNDRPVMTPSALLRRQVDYYFDLLGSDEIFIRPDSGAKVFPGFVMSRSTWQHEFNCLDQLTGLTPETIVVISPVKPIAHEYRFVIVNRQVVTGSRYMKHGVLDVDSRVDPRCRSLADRIAAEPYQVDLAYTCDVGMVGDQAVVIELNAFSTSGLYACDRVAAFKAVAEVAWLEFCGELTLGE